MLGRSLILLHCKLDDDDDDAGETTNKRASFIYCDLLCAVSQFVCSRLQTGELLHPGVRAERQELEPVSKRAARAKQVESSTGGQGEDKGTTTVSFGGLERRALHLSILLVIKYIPLLHCLTFYCG